MSGIGLLLVLVGATLVVAEAHVPTHGALGTAAGCSCTVTFDRKALRMPEFALI